MLTSSGEPVHQTISRRQGLGAEHGRLVLCECSRRDVRSILKLNPKSLCLGSFSLGHLHQSSSFEHCSDFSSRLSVLAS